MPLTWARIVSLVQACAAPRAVTDNGTSCTTTAAANAATTQRCRRGRVRDNGGANVWSFIRWPFSASEGRAALRNDPRLSGGENLRGHSDTYVGLRQNLVAKHYRDLGR